MSGTKSGAQQATKTNMRIYGKNYYSVIGSMGGSKGKKDGTLKGFAAMKANGQIQKVRDAGRKGGSSKQATIIMEVNQISIIKRLLRRLHVN
jgi:hypothetical protein